MDDVYQEIFKYLSYKDILTCARVCKLWYKLAMNDALWKILHDEKYLLVKYILDGTYYEKFKKYTLILQF